MRDFGLRAINRGETQKTMSRRQQAKIAAGVTPAISKSSKASKSISNAPEESDESDNDLTENPKKKSKSSRSRASQSDDDGLDSEDELSNFANSGKKAATLKKARGGAIGPTDLRDAIEALLDRRKAIAYKGTRENLLAIIVYQVRHFVVTDDVHEYIEELLPVLLRSAKLIQSGSQDEARLALDALSAIASTINSENLYEETHKILRRIITLNPDPETKASAILTYGMFAYFGARPATLLKTTMPFLIDIVSSDGDSIRVADNPLVVTAALQQWGLLATRAELSAAAVREPMEAFVDQLGSSDPDVLISAGQNVALVYEQSYVPRFESKTGSEYKSKGQLDILRGREMHDSEDEDVEQCRARYTSVFDPYPRHSQLVDTLTELSKISGKSISSDVRRRLRSSFSDILNSVSRHPRLGPGYQTALDKNTGQASGNKLVVQMSSTTAGEKYRGEGTVLINRWWQLIRLQAMRRALAGGVAVHWTAGTDAVVWALEFGPPRSRSGPASESQYVTDDVTDDEDKDEDKDKDEDEYEFI